MTLLFLVYLVCITRTAVFCPFTYPQTRTSLAREWLEDEWSSALVFTTFTQPFLTGVILENVKMPSERYCFSELEKVSSFEMLALHKYIYHSSILAIRRVSDQLLHMALVICGRADYRESAVAKYN